jgi:hypothetical protein
MAMSEFKFACPVCGQHITADSSSSGSQLDCPTCFRKIIVPQAPASSESKIVLSAQEAGRRGPPVSTAPAEVVARPSMGGKKLWIWVVLVLAAGIAGYVIRDQVLQRASRVSEPPPQTRTASPSGEVKYALDLSGAEIPAETAFGTIAGRDFVCDRAVLQGGTLNLRMGKLWPPQLGLSVHLYARQASELSGKSSLVSTNNLRSPRIVLRWKDETNAYSATFTNHFAMKLEFGTLNGNRLPGKIYICLPDGERSRVAGVFNAEVRRPPSSN